MAWVPIATAAASALSSMFGGRSSRKADKLKQQREFQQRQYESDMARQRSLEDRKYTEQAIGAYRPYQSGGLMSPEYTDPTTVKPVDPYAPKPRVGP